MKNQNIINRLTDQADEHAIDYVGSLRQRGVQVLPEYYEQAFRKKFAELIVGECIHEIHVADMSNLHGKGYYLDKVAEHIEKHFGLET